MEAAMNYPQDLKYTENDEWIRVEGDLGTIGITDYAQDQLSDIVYVEISAEIGDALDQGGAFAEVESVKAAAEVYLPVAGVIREINESLADEPESVNADPYGVAWMVKVEISDSSQLLSLMDAAAYEKHVQGRES
jgi:glycine cleavage system H protein